MSGTKNVTFEVKRVSTEGLYRHGLEVGVELDGFLHWLQIKVGGFYRGLCTGTVQQRGGPEEPPKGWNRAVFSKLVDLVLNRRNESHQYSSNIIFVWLVFSITCKSNFVKTARTGLMVESQPQ